MNKRLFSLFVILGLTVMLGAASANADQIGILSSGIGSATVTCTGGGNCSLSITQPIGGGVGTAFFYSPDGTPLDLSTPGEYSFNGGPTNFQTTDGGISFTVTSQDPWTFHFDDGAGGNSLDATATWQYFNNAGALGFQQAGLLLTPTSLTCTLTQVFCSDFQNGAEIDMTFNSANFNLGTLATEEGCSVEQPCVQSDIKISSGEVNATVPEPGTLALFGSGLIGIASFLRRKINRS